MRRSIVTVGAVVLGLVAFTPGAAGAAPAPGPDLTPAQKTSLDLGLSIAPKAAPGSRPAGPNPYLALVPNAAKADYAGWAAYMKQEAGAKAAQRLRALAGTSLAPAAATVVDEDELDGTNGANDTPANAQRINGFAAGSRLRILGRLDPDAPSVATIPPTAEDDGAIPLAGATGVGLTRSGVTTSAQIGDGPNGSAGTGTGDFDFYRVDAKAGQVITVKTATPTGPLDTVVVLYDAQGEDVASGDDTGTSLDSTVTYKVPAAGTFYAMVAAYNGVPQDPFDSGSGTNATNLPKPSEGPYDVTITAAADDTDFFAVKLKPGDVLGATVKGAPAYLTVYDSDKVEVHGSDQDASFIYPAASPLPGGGNAVTDHVATKAGWYYVGVATGSGSYDITVEAYRPALEKAPPVQTLFLDFDGARVNTYVVGGGNGVADLSPFSAFITKWGLTREDEDALIDEIVAGVTENLKQDLIDSGLNRRVRLKVLNSKDDPDPWGKPNVSRIVVGGTIAESGINTIGIAQSIDPGNFETEETALVLLDVLSDDDGGPAALNTYLTPASDRIGFVGQALSNVISHEGGHFFGNFHTDNVNDTANLMDAGGSGFPVLFGVGPDGVGGTADDVDVDFGKDDFIPQEGFVGTEDTLGRVTFGLTS